MLSNFHFLKRTLHKTNKTVSFFISYTFYNAMYKDDDEAWMHYLYATTDWLNALKDRLIEGSWKHTKKKQNCTVILEYFVQVMT